MDAAVFFASARAVYPATRFHLIGGNLLREGPTEDLDAVAVADLRCTMQNFPGWAISGGSWITRDRAILHLVWSRLDVAAEGGEALRLSVPQPSEDEWRVDAMRRWRRSLASTFDMTDIQPDNQAARLLSWSSGLVGSVAIQRSTVRWQRTERSPCQA